MSLNPEVSVVMSAFNSEEFISDSINSILNQEFKDFEFIIVNDGSTDNTLSIINKYQKIDNRIKVINQKNCGIPKSLNNAVSVANSNFIARIDADDISLPSRLSTQLKYLKSNSNLGFVFSSFILIDKSGKKIQKKIISTNSYQVRSNLLNGINNIAHSSVMFRKDLFFEVGKYRNRFKKSQDIDLWIRMTDKYEFSNAGSEPLVFIRNHDNQISRNENDIFKYISILSYLMRKNLRQDPLDLKETEFNKFFEWIRNYLHSSKEFVKQEKIREFKLFFLNLDFSLDHYYRFFSNVLFSKYSYIIILEKLVGRSIYKDLYKSWTQKINS